MTFSDLTPENTQEIVGGDGLHKVDVVEKADGSKRLLVDSETSISTSLAIAQEHSQNTILNNSTYTDIYTTTGVKTLSGFALEFDDKNVWVRLEIDGEEIFDLYCKKMKDILDWNSASLPPMYVSWNDGLKAFYFTPNFPIKSTTSLKIQARGNGKKYKASIIQVSN